MTELRDLWEEYKRIELSGAGRNKRAKEIEARIHEIQKGMGTSLYDFDKREEKQNLMGKPTIEVPSVVSLPDKPNVEERAPQANFTLEQAKKIVGDNDYRILEECNRVVEAQIVCVEHISMGRNPDNKKNPARRGQSINQTIFLFNKRKEE